MLFKKKNKIGMFICLVPFFSIADVDIKEIHSVVEYKNLSIPNNVITEINELSKEYISKNEYYTVIEKTIKVTTNSKNKICDEDNCMTTEMQLLNNFEIGSLEKGYYRFSQKYKQINEQESRNKLFQVLENISNGMTEINNAKEITILLNTISEMEENSNKQFLNLAYECQKDENDGGKIIDCMSNNGKKYGNIFLDTKLKCYKYSQEKNIYTNQEQLSRDFDSCINEEMNSNNYKQWIGYQFFTIGSLVYYLENK